MANDEDLGEDELEVLREKVEEGRKATSPGQLNRKIPDFRMVGALKYDRVPTLRKLEARGLVQRYGAGGWELSADGVAWVDARLRGD